LEEIAIEEEVSFEEVVEIFFKVFVELKDRLELLRGDKN